MSEINSIKIKELPEASYIADTDDLIIEGAVTKRIAFKKLWDHITEYVSSNGGVTALDIYPVGSVYMSVNSTSPAELFGGTWTRWGNGRVPVGVDTSQTEFDAAGKTGGSKTHTLTVGQIPKHTHGSKSLTGKISNFLVQAAGYIGASGIFARSASGSVYKAATSSEVNGYDEVTLDASHEHEAVGSSQAHNNLQPYITCYMWQRTK